MATLREKMLLPLLTFLIWMLASFFCHKLAKMALQIYVTNDDLSTFQPLFCACLVTVCQTLWCCACVNVKTVKGVLFCVIALSHFAATLATNTSFALTHASSTMAVKMLEPITSAILQTVMFHTPMGVESLSGLVIVVIGSVMYVGNPAASGTMARAVGLAFVSNLTLGIRNVAIKLSQNSGSNKNQLRSWTTIGILSTAVMVMVGGMYVMETLTSEPETPLRATSFALLSLGSSVCHVTYSYVSTYLVLRYMSVVGHALANIFKRVLVVLLLHASGRRSASVWNWSGLVLCTLGLMLYNRKKLMSASADSTAVSAKSSGSLAEKGNTHFPSSSGITRTKRKLLTCLLLPLLLVFAVCTIPPQTQMIYLSQQALDQNLALPIDPLRSPERVYISPVLLSRPMHRNKSTSNHLFNLRFGFENMIDGKPLLPGPVEYQPERKSSSQIEEFLSIRSLISTPLETDGLSPYLTTAQEVIDEAQRVHLNLFKDLFRGKKYAVLMELASHENKGDAAISVGELELLEKMGIELLYYMDVKKCKLKNFTYALEAARRRPMNEVIVLMHGGGNLFGYPDVDVCRGKGMAVFKGYDLAIFPQSIYMKGSRSHFDFARKLYCCNSNLTMMMRDRLSLTIAQRLFNNGTRLLLVPDIAMQIGHHSRFLPPFYDVIWQKRKDSEGPMYAQHPERLFPANLTVLVWDWLHMTSAVSNSSIVKAVNVVHNGLAILQKGRVVVTDRLHGHLLCTILNIPHVLVDNGEQKLSSYHNTWTRGLTNCRMTDNPMDAARLALELLHEYRDSLPPTIRAVHSIDKGKF